LGLATIPLVGEIQPLVAQREWPVAQVVKLVVRRRGKSFGKNPRPLRPTPELLPLEEFTIRQSADRVASKLAIR